MNKQTVKRQGEANAWGGSRQGAGRPVKQEFETTDAPATPQEWLWYELERRLGKGATNEIHREYNAKAQEYQKHRIKTKRQGRG